MNNAHSSDSWFAITLQQHVPCVETCQITWIFLRMVGVYISPGLHWQNVSSDPSAKGQYVHSYNFQMKVFPTFFFLVQTNVSDYKTNLNGFLLFFFRDGECMPSCWLICSNSWHLSWGMLISQNQLRCCIR